MALHLWMILKTDWYYVSKRDGLRYIKISDIFVRPQAGVDHTRIVNLMKQKLAAGNNSHPGKARTKYVNHALRELRKEIEKENFKPVALPKLTTGLDGLDWNEVKTLITEHLGDLNIPVIVFTEYKKDQQVAEGL